ncbi:hypothetical protein K1T71_007515 [Dendrolimus kikuchii]|uniref:Uncharacterized protein n=1 Tax=Dendrolimus kikuchii TaxID=765133 RepID=A0ACC1D0W5_9NEOP|nr:hypothetical protein K1T71_007515 [Dendrolimus kikuchii]
MHRRRSQRARAGILRRTRRGGTSPTAHFVLLQRGSFALSEVCLGEAGEALDLRITTPDRNERTNDAEEATGALQYAISILRVRTMFKCAEPGGGLEKYYFYTLIKESWIQ